MNDIKRSGSPEFLPDPQPTDMILRLAMDVEEEGSVFYNKLARIAPNPAVKDIFLSFVKDELQHKDDLAKISQSLSAQYKTFSSPVNIVALMRNCVDMLKKAIRNSEPLEIDEVDLGKAIDIGIRNEKDAIEIYSNLLNVFPHDLNKVISKIIDEEKEHLSKLLRIKGSRLA